MKVPAYTEVGKTARELLYGGKGGVFQYDKVVTVSTKAANGVEWTTSAKQKGDKVDPSLKAAYKRDKLALSFAVSGVGKVNVTSSVSDIVPGLNASLSGAVPDQASGKLGIDYAMPYLTLKSSLALTSTPKVDINLATGYEGAVLGGDVGYDTAKGAITRWAVGGGYTAKDFQVAAWLVDMGETVKASYAQNIDATQVVGAEVVRSLTKETTTFTLGYSKLMDDGSLAKVRLDNAGVASVLYEQELRARTRLALSTQFDATNLDKAPKIGIAWDMKN